MVSFDGPKKVESYLNVILDMSCHVDMHKFSFVNEKSRICNYFSIRIAFSKGKNTVHCIINELVLILLIT